MRLWEKGCAFLPWVEEREKDVLDTKFLLEDQNSGGWSLDLLDILY